MADEAKEKATTPEAASPEAAPEKKARGNPLALVTGLLANRMVFIVSLVVVEVITAYFVVTALIEPRLAGETPVVHAEKPDAKAAEHEVGPMLKIDDVVVNLTGSAESHFLSASLVIEIEPAKKNVSEEELKEHEPRVKDVIIHTLSAKSDEEVRSMSGREEVREDLRHGLEKALEPMKLKAVYFTEFVVQ